MDNKAVKLNKKSLKSKLLQYWPLYVMLLPAIIYYILICYVPMAGNVLAFKEYSFKKGIWGSDFVGLRYFESFFKSYDALRLIKNTLTVGFIKCILEFPFAIILALLLNELKNLKFKRRWKYLLPYGCKILSWNSLFNGLVEKYRLGFHYLSGGDKQCRHLPL